MVQWDYSGKWDTRKKWKKYIEYICSVIAPCTVGEQKWQVALQVLNEVHFMPKFSIDIITV